MKNQDINKLKTIVPIYPRISLKESGMCKEETPDKPFKRVFTYMTLVRLNISEVFYLYLIRMDEEQGEVKDLASITQNLIRVHQEAFNIIHSNLYDVSNIVIDDDQKSTYISKFSLVPFERVLIELGVIKNK